MPSSRGRELSGSHYKTKVNLKRVPAEIQKIIFTVTIFEAEERNQNFGQVKNAFVRLVNDQTQEEVLHYNLEESFSVETALIMAELYRQDGGWTMKAVGTAYKGGAQELIDRYAAPPQSATKVRQPVINWRYRVPASNK